MTRVEPLIVFAGHHVTKFSKLLPTELVLVSPKSHMLKLNPQSHTILGGMYFGKISHEDGAHMNGVCAPMKGTLEICLPSPTR